MTPLDLPVLLRTPGANVAMADARGLHGQHELERELAPGKRSSDLSRSLGAEQQEQEHTSIALTTCRCRSLECRGLTRVPCRRDDRRRRSRDSPSGVAPGTQREQGNKNMGDDETEVPACQAAFSLAPTPRRGVRIGSGVPHSAGREKGISLRVAIAAA